MREAGAFVAIFEVCHYDLANLDPNLVRHALHILVSWSHAYAHPHFMECATGPREVKGVAQVTQQPGLEAVLVPAHCPIPPPLVPCMVMLGQRKDEVPPRSQT